MAEARDALAQGVAHLEAGRSDAAMAAFRAALAADPVQPLAVRNLGVLLIERARFDEALGVADAALAHAPGHGEALLLRGEGLAGLARHAEAAQAYEAVLAAGGPAYEALCQLGLARSAMGRHDEALEALDAAVALRPEDALARHRRAIVRLQLRDFAGGWADYEARLDLKRFLPVAGGIVNARTRPLLTPTTRPDALAGKRVLLLGEQGVGDQIMFASMIPDLVRLGARVGCVCDPRLVGLFAASFPQAGFVGPEAARLDLSAVDAVLAMGSLGGLFRPDAAAFPGSPYLRPSPASEARWAQRLGPRTARLRVGLSWRGGSPNTRQDQRSLSLGALGPVLDLPGCEFVSLQYGDVESEVAAANHGRAQPIRIFPAADIDDFDDLAGLVANLDLVVSVQTTLVHLTGALGRTCLTLIPHVAEWRYTAAGPAMPWYRSVRLFRQAAPGDWAPVLAEVAAAVAARLES
ncbi:MAG: tetratricopeptide repeat protein [Phenylobacterium sp.]|uniref:tetratricopeptide repeat protein n=1 Tax=Phenylobacterium sp. TaxID=1871053 RepID=UPI001A3FA082|nr:tetratricopeptide repeat protein [Phenylobacterium sp.]MBL8771891.1 tetratricopeptide repeat protein [Phenylobacterium sp.]